MPPIDLLHSSLIRCNTKCSRLLRLEYVSKGAATRNECSTMATALVDFPIQHLGHPMRTFYQTRRVSTLEILCLGRKVNRSTGLLPCFEPLDPHHDALPAFLILILQSRARLFSTFFKLRTDCTVVPCWPETVADLLSAQSISARTLQALFTSS